MPSLLMVLKAYIKLLEIILYNCHFHQKKTINKYLTRNPKLDIAIDLQKVMYNLTTTTEVRFINKLDIWYDKYKDILYQKSINEDTNKSSFKHPKIISSYKKLIKKYILPSCL